MRLQYYKESEQLTHTLKITYELITAEYDVIK